MKLELKHIAPYLPYKLNCMLTFDMRDDFAEENWVTDNEIFNQGAVWTYAGYCDDDLCIPLGDGDFSGFLIRHDQCYISVGKAAKPILRPLSDLEKDDYELKILSWYENVDHPQVTVYRSKSDFSITVTYSIMGDVFTDSIVSRSETLDTRRWIFDEMVKNHFDVFGLIEAGLAVDINTLETVNN